jgi:hypothetical protein
LNQDNTNNTNNNAVPAVDDVNAKAVPVNDMPTPPVAETVGVMPVEPVVEAPVVSDTTVAPNDQTVPVNSGTDGSAVTSGV